MEETWLMIVNGFKTDDISEFMTFSRFAKTLRPYYGQNDNQDDFVIKLFDNVLDDYNEKAKGNSEEHNKIQSYNPFRDTDNFQSDTIARYFKGTRISPDTYKKMLSYRNQDKFKSFMEKPENPTEENDESLISQISEIYPDANEDNYCEKYAELFCKIIERGAKEPKKQAGRKKKIHYPKETNAQSMETLEEKITAAASAISKSIKAENLPDNPNIAFCIRDKIKHDHNLRRTIESDLAYFNIVNKAFCSAAENGGKPSAFIRDCVHNHYLKLRTKKDLSEEDIVKNMRVYFAPLALIPPDSDEARIIVSYFIQLCEVFDAPTRQND